MEKRQSLTKKIFVIIYFLIVVITAFLAYLKPQYNWDLIPYTATIISIEQSNIQEVHDETYNLIKESVPNQVFKDLTTGDKYRENMYTDYISFNQQLPFYSIKPLYIYLVYILHKFGLGIIKATYLISIFSYIGISIILFLFTNKLKTGSIGIIVLSLLVLAKPFYIIAKLSTPDALSAFTITLSLFLILNNKLKILPSILLVLSIFIRPDNLIIANILFIYFALFSPKQYRIKIYHSVCFILMGTVSYFTINHFAHSYGWSVLFTHSFIQQIDRPEEYTGHLSIISYLKVLASHGAALFLSTNIFNIIVVGLIGLMMRNDSNIDNVYIHLVKIMMFTMTLFFLLMPSFEVDRYFITEYIIIIISTLSILSTRYISSSKQSLSIIGEIRG